MKIPKVHGLLSWTRAHTHLIHHLRYLRYYQVPDGETQVTDTEVSGGSFLRQRVFTPKRKFMVGARGDWTREGNVHAGWRKSVPALTTGLLPPGRHDLWSVTLRKPEFKQNYHCEGNVVQHSVRGYSEASTQDDRTRRPTCSAVVGVAPGGMEKDVPPGPVDVGATYHPRGT
ncbi:hypothetical protein RUM43_008976 [Polyplax serrata]|uniref:Uncharacterized protein n=1 Tax=Polyplax serrata TaxID=468196 RepID=A0AAN8P6W4_POLSC